MSGTKTLIGKWEQYCLATCAVVALVGIGVFFHWQNAITGRMIDIDHAPALTNSFHIEINQATWPEWNLLPGIGEGLAKRIVEFRNARGGFDSPSDLLQVPGIGPKTLSKIEPYLALGDSDFRGVVR